MSILLNLTYNQFRKPNWTSILIWQHQRNHSILCWWGSIFDGRWSVSRQCLQGGKWVPFLQKGYAWYGRWKEIATCIIPLMFKRIFWRVCWRFFFSFLLNVFWDHYYMKFSKNWWAEIFFACGFKVHIGKFS